MKDFARKLDLRGQADILRRQLEDSIVKKIRFSGSKELITFAHSQLKMPDLVHPFLDFYSMRLQALLTKI